MAFQKEYLDLVLVSGGLLIMFSYNLFYLYRYSNDHKGFESTELSFENRKKEEWVRNFMKVPTATRNVSSALCVIGSNITAATQLATISLTLCTLIGAWTTYSSKDLFQTDFIHGDTSQSTISIKCMCLLTCFLVAFSCFVQSVKHLTFASYLMSNPVEDDDNVEDVVKEIRKADLMRSRVKVDDNVEDVVKEVRKAGEFWLLGLRALYFALNFLVWFFGSFPMFVSSIVMVIILFCHDTRDLKKLIMTKISK